MRFILIHGGAGHGAWCWERAIPELERLGHDAVALDMPGFGARAQEKPSFAGQRDTILSAMRHGDVLVGHSGGGYGITVAADAAPEKVRHLVYLAATLPVEGQSIRGHLAEVHAAEPGNPVGADQREGYDFDTARRLFYGDCDDATARWAFDHLTPTPAELFSDFLHTPVSVPRFWAANLPRSFIRCTRDQAQGEDRASKVVARLGVEPLYLESDHSPFLSRPAHLAEMLVAATATSPTGTPQPN